MFKKYIKKLIREINNEACDTPKKTTQETEYIYERITEINEKLSVLERHLKINIVPIYNPHKFEVIGWDMPKTVTGGCEVLGK